MTPQRTSLSEFNHLRPVVSPLALDEASLSHFLDHCHRRRHPARSDIFRPGDTANTLYYVISGSLSIISVEDDGRELVLGYCNAGEFVGEMGLFVSANVRQVLLRTRTPCELAELSYERLHQLFATSLASECPKILYAIGAQLSKRLLDTSRKASRLAFLDVTGRIVRTLNDLCLRARCAQSPAGHADPCFPPGAGAHRRLFARDGRQGAQATADRRQAARPRQDRRGFRHPLSRGPRRQTRPAYARGSTGDGRRRFWIVGTARPHGLSLSG